MESAPVGESVMMTTVLTVPPRFTKELAEKTLTLPVGGSTAVELPFAASPQPKVTWSFNGGKLPDPKRFKTDTISAMTSLTMAKVVRNDAGKFTVTIENEHGKCELTVTLVVLGTTRILPITFASRWIIYIYISISGIIYLVLSFFFLPLSYLWVDYVLIGLEHFLFLQYFLLLKSRIFTVVFV